MAVRAQPGERVRRIGVFMNLASDDAEGQSRSAAFLQGLQELGWAIGRRWSCNRSGCAMSARSTTQQERTSPAKFWTILH